MPAADPGEPILQRAAGPGEEGRRVDQVLCAWLEEPRGRTQERLAGGEVLVDGRVVAKSHRVRAGERLVVMSTPEAPLAPADEAAEVQAPVVRYQDEDVAVIAKPAGVVMHRGAGVRGATLVDALQESGMTLSHAGDPTRPGIVHRLDRGTSGLLAIAKTDQAYFGLRAAFAAHDVQRSYLAVVDGVPDPSRATIDAPIGRSTSHRTRFAIDPRGRPSVTHYDVTEAHGRAAVLDARLETGRTHQVRVHLSGVGHPVAGDLTYGASPVVAAALGLTRPALHARKLGFAHPVTGLPILVEEPPPVDLVDAIAKLRAGFG